MLKRGKVLRDTNAGPGLLTIDGKQYAFTLEQMWTSDVPPRTGMTVEVFFNSAGAPEQVSAVPESQIAREGANAAFSGAKRHSQALRSGFLKGISMGTVATLVVLLISWVYLPSLLIRMPYSGAAVTFWGMLGYLAAPNTALVFGQNPQYLNSGVWGMLAFAALLAPLVGAFWKDKRAGLGGAVPLVFMTIAVVVLRASFGHSAATPAVGNTAVENFANSIVQDATNRAWQNTSFGAGLYAASIAASYLVISGARRFLAERA